jgi:hypothetical protein
VRSYSLSLFVVSFSILVPALVATPLPTPVSYPLGLALSTTLNLAAAELWIRHHRTGRRRPEALAICRPGHGERSFPPIRLAVRGGCVLQL